MSTKSEEIIFLDQPVLVVRKKNRRRLSVTMHPDQPLKVLTNQHLPAAAILAFLESKKKWVEQNLQHIEKLQAQFKKPELKDGELFSYLGELKYFKFANVKNNPLFRIEDGFLMCYQPAAQDLEKKLQAFFKIQAIDYLEARMKHWVDITRLTPETIKYRKPHTRWGSCSSKKTITLNWKLICQPENLIDYVIVHELCHLKFMNHSADFWNLVESILPDFKTCEEVLKKQERLGLFL